MDYSITELLTLCNNPLEYKHPLQVQISQMGCEVLLVCSQEECFEQGDFRDSDPCASHGHRLLHILSWAGSSHGHHIPFLEDYNTVDYTSSCYLLHNNDRVRERSEAKICRVAFIG
uniref:Uncharacterized protein n=1 Tax=Rhizophora mucronata TaxID=61149 RepID=A0A2P2K5N1_RHIMU